MNLPAVQTMVKAVNRRENIVGHTKEGDVLMSNELQMEIR